MNNYKSDTCSVEYMSEMEPGEAEAMIGKTIAKIKATEYKLLITFTDASYLEVEGACRDYVALYVSYCDEMGSNDA